MACCCVSTCPCVSARSLRCAGAIVHARRSCGRKDGLEDAAYDFPVSADDVVIVRPLRRRAPSRSAAEEKVRHWGIVRRRSDGAKTLSGVDNQTRGILEKDLTEKRHGRALANLDEEKEAWNTADAALRTAFGTLQEAGDLPSPHAFAQWLEKVAPPDAYQLAAAARESESFTAEAIMIAADGLSHDARMKLHTDLLNQATAHLNRGGE